jgi:hypothetical protein
MTGPDVRHRIRRPSSARSIAAGRSLAFVVAAFSAFTSTVAYAQQDGARGYTLGPEGVQAILLIGTYTSANQTTPNAPVGVGSDISSNVTAIQYVVPLNLSGRSAAIFPVLPIGTISGSVESGGTTVANGSSGLGDFVVGGFVGLVGMPALPPEKYVAYEPGFSLAALAVVMAPTGEYDPTKIFNLGTNRWTFRAGLPMYYALGQSYVDPHLTTFELKPTLTFYTANDDPYGADRQTQDPLFELEGHVTRNLNSKFWVAADAMYQYGSGTSTDGAGDDNTRMNLNIGATVGASINASMQLRVSYAHSIAHNDFGMQGQGARIMLIGAF